MSEPLPSPWTLEDFLAWEGIQSGPNAMDSSMEFCEMMVGGRHTSP
ncbi:MAG: hypothetical protein M3294_04915 [Pseudomonadota bacterium]|nr:hypothetical protein [Pseudomonadota bacterium]